MFYGRLVKQQVQQEQTQCTILIALYFLSYVFRAHPPNFLYKTEKEKEKQALNENSGNNNATCSEYMLSSWYAFFSYVTVFMRPRWLPMPRW